MGDRYTPVHSRLDCLMPPAALRNNGFVYLDDLLVVNARFIEHIDLLIAVAQCFCNKKVQYLGFVLGNDCIRTDEVQAFKNLQAQRLPKSNMLFSNVCLVSHP